MHAPWPIFGGGISGVPYAPQMGWAAHSALHPMEGARWSLPTAATPPAMHLRPGAGAVIFVLSCWVFMPAAAEGAALVAPMRFGRQLVIGRDVFPSPFFPGDFSSWRVSAHCLLSEVFWTRRLAGYRGVPAPLFMATVLALLPGEQFVQAQCLLVHKDGSWEGRIVAPTVNDEPPRSLPLANLQLRMMGHDAVLLPVGGTGYRQHQVVRWVWRGQWMPADMPGGMA